MLSAAKFMAIAAVLAGLTSAQLPSCAQACVSKFTTGSQIGGCSNIDAKCICANQSFLGNIACCLAGACDTADQDSATQYALSFCKAAGVTGLPTAVSCTSTIASSTTAPSSSSATGAITSPTTSASSAGSSASSVSSSAASVLSSVSSSVSSVAASITSAASSKASSSSSSASAAASTTKNAGSHNVAGMGAGVIGGLAAAVALL